MKDEVIYLQKWQSPVGPLFIYTNQKSLLALTFNQNDSLIRKKLKTQTVAEKESKIGLKTIHQLKQYFQGRRRNFTLPVNMDGTVFQKKAWTVLSQIPFGKTLSYSAQAKKMKATKAVRAVGSANGQNPIAIIVPCHRVIGTNGKLSGYAAGTYIKARLLRHEGIAFS